MWEGSRRQKEQAGNDGQEWRLVFHSVAGDRLTSCMKTWRRSESEACAYGESISGKEKSKYKDPEMAACLCLLLCMKWETTRRFGAENCALNTLKETTRGLPSSIGLGAVRDQLIYMTLDQSGVVKIRNGQILRYIINRKLMFFKT